MAVSVIDVPVIVLRQHVYPIDDVRRGLLANLRVSYDHVTDFVAVCAAAAVRYTAAR